MPNKKTYRIDTLDHLPQIAEELFSEYGQAKAWAFLGEMGAGKTTLIKSILKVLGVEEWEGSPTYSIVNVYDIQNREIYHFDLYRLEDINEAIEIGMEDMLYSNGLSLIEWPNVIEDLLPEDTIWFNLSILDDSQKRILTVNS